MDQPTRSFVRRVAAGVLAAALVAPSPLPAAEVDPPATALDRARIANETAQARYYAKQVEPPETHDVPAWLQTLLGGLLAIGGGMLTTWATNRATEERARRDQRRTYDRQRGQLRLALDDLRAALAPIVGDGPLPAFLAESLLYSKPDRPLVADRDDPYYRKYDLVDTVYRFCAVLGWIEVFRTDPTFLRGSEADNRRHRDGFAAVRAALSDPFAEAKTAGGFLRDGFILEDDQRAIGEKMTARRRGDVVIGYAAFCEQLFRDPRRDDPTGDADGTGQNWWIWNATRFFVELGAPGGPDFRRERLRRIVAALDGLVDDVRPNGP